MQQIPRDHAAVGKNSVGSFSGQARAGAGKGGTDGSGEFLPARRPLDQELGSVVEVSHFFELESFGHGEIVETVGGEQTLSILLHLNFNSIPQCGFRLG